MNIWDNEKTYYKVLIGLLLILQTLYASYICIPNNIEKEYLTYNNFQTEPLKYRVNTIDENENIDNIPEDPSNTYATKRELLAKTKIVKQTWSILEIYQKTKSHRLNLSPDYQRNNIWKTDKQTAFIESLFMGIIIPPIYVVEIPGANMLEESSYEVVDGKQRLSTIINFLKDEIVLHEKSLEYYTDWFGGKKYSDITSEYKELTNSMLSSVLDIYVITANSPEFTKYDIFSRLNKGAEKLKVNEIRKAIYRSQLLLDIDTFIKERLNKELNPEFTAQYNKIFTRAAQIRYDDYGRFYRSVAFYIKSNIETQIVDGYNSRPREMINNVLYGIQKGEIVISSEELETILVSTLELKEKLIDNTDGADYIIDACIPFVVRNKELVYEKLETIINNPKIKESLLKSPATTSNVNARLKEVCDIMQ